jgi:hypothetical protein
MVHRGTPTAASSRRVNRDSQQRAHENPISPTSAEAHIHTSRACRSGTDDLPLGTDDFPEYLAEEFDPTFDVAVGRAVDSETV